MPESLTRAAKQEQTRSKLIESALEAFVDHGFHGASLQDIAVRAGFTKGAIYANFNDKEELFLAVLDARLERQGRELASIYEADRAGHDDVQQRMVEFLSNAFRREWGLLSLEAILYASRHSPDLLKEMALRYRQTDEQTAALSGCPPELKSVVAITQTAINEGLMLRSLVDPEVVSVQNVEAVYELLDRTLDTVSSQDASAERNA